MKASARESIEARRAREIEIGRLQRQIRSLQSEFNNDDHSGDPDCAHATTTVQSGILDGYLTTAYCCEWCNKFPVSPDWTL